MLCIIFISFQTKLSQAYHIHLKKMYVYCVLYANTYYDLIRMSMRFIIIIIIYFYITFFTICNLQKLLISSGNISINDPEFFSGYFLLRNVS